MQDQHIFDAICREMPRVSQQSSLEMADQDIDLDRTEWETSQESCFRHSVTQPGKFIKAEPTSPAYVTAEMVMSPHNDVTTTTTCLNVCMKKESSLTMEGELVKPNPDLQQKLKTTLTLKRRRDGLPEPDTKHVLFPEPRKYQLRKDEEEKVERRREQNRRAAERCRNKKRNMKNVYDNKMKELALENRNLYIHNNELSSKLRALLAISMSLVNTCTCKVNNHPSLQAARHIALWFEQSTKAAQRVNPEAVDTGQPAQQLQHGSPGLSPQQSDFAPPSVSSPQQVANSTPPFSEARPRTSSPPRNTGPLVISPSVSSPQQVANSTPPFSEARPRTTGPLVISPSHPGPQSSNRFTPPPTYSPSHAHCVSQLPNSQISTTANSSQVQPFLQTAPPVLTGYQDDQTYFLSQKMTSNKAVTTVQTPDTIPQNLQTQHSSLAFSTAYSSGQGHVVPYPCEIDTALDKAQDVDSTTNDEKMDLENFVDNMTPAQYETLLNANQSTGRSHFDQRQRNLLGPQEDVVISTVHQGTMETSQEELSTTNLDSSREIVHESNGHQYGANPTFPPQWNMVASANQNAMINSRDTSEKAYLYLCLSPNSVCSSTQRISDPSRGQGHIEGHDLVGGHCLAGGHDPFGGNDPLQNAPQPPDRPMFQVGVHQHSTSQTTHSPFQVQGSSRQREMTQHNPLHQEQRQAGGSTPCQSPPSHPSLLLFNSLSLQSPPHSNCKTSPAHK